jgi:putative oxidoreductase
MSTSHASISLVARALLSVIFILAGLQKITGYEVTVAYMQAFGVPGALLPLAIVAELGGGLAILVGFFARMAALALAGFCIVAGAIFHSNFADDVQMVLFLKNLALAGGLLLLFANGPGAWAVNRK